MNKPTIPAAPVIVTRGAYAEAGTSLAFKTGTWRAERPVHKHWGAPCHFACPAGEDAQAWIAKLQEGHDRAAWETLVAVNPLPAITGRVCPHPCETGCNRGQFDAPLAIHNLERYLGDEALAKGWPYPDIAEPAANAPRVAIVGAGPAGLSAAYHALRRGLKPVLFETLPEAGGLLRSAIPMTRLPRSVIDAELERLLALGIDFKPRHRLGRDMTLGELQADFDAVFLGVGCQAAKEWSIDGAVPPDLHEGLALLKAWVDHGTIPVGKRVAVHGGGNTAMDICRIMKRHGAEQVYLVTASGLPGPDTAGDDVLNVVPRELEEGIEEGIIVHPHGNVQRLLMRGSRVVGVELVSLRKLLGGDGRKSRVSFEGTERVLEVDMVVPCIGEMVDPAGLETVIGAADYLSADRSGRVAGQGRLYTGGDARGDRGTVSAAIGDGRQAALAMEADIRGRDLAQPGHRQSLGFGRLNLHYFDRGGRALAPKVAAAERDDITEIEGPLTRHQVGPEVARCFSCGNCLACDNCWTLCPDNAVIKTVEVASDGSHYVFDYDYCKGCGLCAAECPSAYIVMEREP